MIICTERNEFFSIWMVPWLPGNSYLTQGMVLWLSGNSYLTQGMVPWLSKNSYLSWVTIPWQLWNHSYWVLWSKMTQWGKMTIVISAPLKLNMMTLIFVMDRQSSKTSNYQISWDSGDKKWWNEINEKILKNLCNFWSARIKV